MLLLLFIFAVFNTSNCNTRHAVAPALGAPPPPGQLAAQHASAMLLPLVIACGCPGIGDSSKSLPPAELLLGKPYFCRATVATALLSLSFGRPVPGLGGLAGLRSTGAVCAAVLFARQVGACPEGAGPCSSANEGCSPRVYPVVQAACCCGGAQDG